MIQAIGSFFGIIMYGCFKLVKDYGFAIVVFTLLSKVILLPISIMVQKNSIKMVKMYPEMNRIKAKYFGSYDMISEEQYQLYKREQYHPMMDLVPIFAQLVILMGVVEVINHPEVYLLRSAMDVQNGINMVFWGIDLSLVPIHAKGITIMIPLLAAVSAWFMCEVQNRANVLQSEQSKTNQLVTMIISVGLSLYLGFFVAAGVGLYWIASNLMSVIQLFILNAWISPKKYIDYQALAESKSVLEKVEKYSKSMKKGQLKEYALKEKQDYKRFFKYQNKQIVFYSEKNGFYKYYQDIIETIIRKTDIVIHYITSDPEDKVFSLASDQFRVYYIGENKLIVLMMKMEADIVFMTTPDLQKYHIKRSMVKDDIEYIYMDHGIGSLNLTLRKHSLDYFDTIFVANSFIYDEMREQEKVFGLKERTLVKWGSGVVDNMIRHYNETMKDGKKKEDKQTILIAPSWQPDNMMDICIDEILEQLLGKGYQVILRPHPQYVRHFEDKLLEMQKKYENHDDFLLQMDFSSNETVYNADLVMTDWSGIGCEYAFTTLRPVLFINTPMKTMNPDYKELSIVPFDIEIRNQLGIALDLDQLKTIDQTVQKLLNDDSYSKEKMEQLRDKYLYNVGHSGEVGADYLINKLIEYSKR